MRSPITFILSLVRPLSVQATDNERGQQPIIVLLKIVAPKYQQKIGIVPLFKRIIGREFYLQKNAQYSDTS